MKLFDYITKNDEQAKATYADLAIIDLGISRQYFAQEKDKLRRAGLIQEKRGVSPKRYILKQKPSRNNAE